MPMLLSDKVKFNDNNKTLSILNSNHVSAKLVGEATITEYDKFGRKVNESVEYNDLTISGANFILEEMFKIKANSRYLHPSSGFPTGTLSNKGSTTIERQNTECYGQNSIFGFMVGVGGDLGASVSNVNFNNTKLTFGDDSTDDSSSSFIPIQITNEANKSGYAVPYKDENGLYYYYVKKFNNVNINTEFSDGSGTVDQSELNRYGVPIISFATCNLSIDNTDCREYLKSENQTLENAYISQIGLVSGKCNDDGTVDDLRLVTYLNFKSRDLTNSENTLTIVYRIYCM